jgi:alpha-beta hydrolase superfamily lysophospholipase
MATPERLEVPDPDGLISVAFRWLPPDGTPIRAVLHVMHGWAEHSMRYDRPARQLAARGIAVYADDHRGHGQTGVRNGTTGELGPGSMEGVVEAVHAVSEHARAQHPVAPFFALGHSWGSMILGRYLERWSDELDGAMLTGTTYAAAGLPMPDPGDFNARFGPARTAYDWLSRDDAEVDAYVADPMCGFDAMHDRPNLAAEPRGENRPIRPSLPLFVFNGADDPVGGDDGGAALAERYRARGLTDVTWRSYPGARHELLNETCRDEVLGDITTWLEARIDP